jgi:hypothetical protein
LRQWRLNHHRALLDAVLSPDGDIPGALLMHLRMAYKDPERYSSLGSSGVVPHSRGSLENREGRVGNGRPVVAQAAELKPRLE